MNKKWMPIVAGTLTIIGGLTFFVFVTFWAFWPLVIPSIFAIVGGIYAWERRKWQIALGGSISALFTLLFFSTRLDYRSEWSWILTIIGIAAVVLTVLSKKEFK
jgi:hypothetical protein